MGLRDNPPTGHKASIKAILFMIRITSFLACFLASICLSQTAWGWGQEGHMVVAEIAYNHLRPDVKAQCDALIAVNLGTYSSSATSNFITAASWADDFKSQLGTGTSHYIDLPLCINGLGKQRGLSGWRGNQRRPSRRAQRRDRSQLKHCHPAKPDCGPDQSRHRLALRAPFRRRYRATPPRLERYFHKSSSARRRRRGQLLHHPRYMDGQNSTPSGMRAADISTIRGFHVR